MTLLDQLTESRQDISSEPTTIMDLDKEPDPRLTGCCVLRPAGCSRTYCVADAVCVP